MLQPLGGGGGTIDYADLPALALGVSRTFMACGITRGDRVATS